MDDSKNSIRNIENEIIKTKFECERLGKQKVNLYEHMSIVSRQLETLKKEDLDLTSKLMKTQQELILLQQEAMKILLPKQSCSNCGEYLSIDDKSHIITNIPGYVEATEQSYWCEKK